ncbi:hypothetical protein [Shewanella xiamenensis]|uniref:hypothetical protein n=1 Tax=Shewanella xiamenensis TaxID=332186 RepID=UPI0021BFF6AE|nr:hypothetical protein [Shewanella xiamenensis]MCT8876668.1 hypothetical protein [Shewanella xiamenensis]
MAVLPNSRWRDKTIKLTSIGDILIDETLSGSVIRTNRGYHQWAFEGETLIQSQFDSKTLYAFLVSKTIEGESFKVMIPTGTQCLSRIHARSATVKAVQPAGERTVSVTSFGIVPEGRYFNFSNHDKLYVIEKVEGDVVHFKPELRQNIDTTTTLSFEPYIYGYIKENDFALEPDTANYQQFKINILEDI